MPTHTPTPTPTHRPHARARRLLRWPHGGDTGRCGTCRSMGRPCASPAWTARPKKLRSAPRWLASPASAACTSSWRRAPVHRRRRGVCCRRRWPPSAASFDDPQPLPPSPRHAAPPRHCRRLLLALACAAGAGRLAWFAAATARRPAWPAALAALAIALAGFGVYRRGAALPRPAEHQRADDGGRDRRFRHRPMGRGGDGHGAVRHRRLIEARAVDRARTPSAGLMRLAPDLAEVRQPDGRWALVPAAEGGGGRHRARAPRRAWRWTAWLSPATAAVDQASVTGESLPVDKTVGDRCSPAPSTSPAHRAARHGLPRSPPWHASSAPVSRRRAAARPRSVFVDRFAAVYTRRRCSCWRWRWRWPGRGCSAGGAGRGLQGAGAAGHRLPCALVIATPVTVVSGSHAAGRGAVSSSRAASTWKRRAARKACGAGQDRHDHRGQAAAGGLDRC